MLTRSMRGFSNESGDVKTAASLLLIIFLLLPDTVFGELQVSDPFPSFDIRNGLDERDYAYLNLRKGFLTLGARTGLNDIEADLLILEFMNRYCITCQKEAPELVHFYAGIEKDPSLKGRVKILGVAIGNDETEVAGFKREFSIPFPIVPDAGTAVYRSIGSPGGSPLFYILRKRERRWIILDGFKGEQSQLDLLMRVRAALSQDTGRMVRTPLWIERPLRRLSTQESLALIRKSIPSARIAKTIPFDSGDLYALKVGKETLFAKAESRRLPCSVCHDITFIYVFDKNGLVRDLIPVQLRKDMNQPFSHADIERIKSLIVGRNMLAPFKFDGKTDAVTSATITSFAVYDAVLHGKEIFDAIRNEGL